MKIACPQCGHACKLGEAACPVCGFPFTLGKILGFYWGRLFSRVKENAVIRCPHCGDPIPLNAKTCPRCGKAVTVGAAVRTTVGPAQQRLRNAVVQATPKTRRWIQWLYLMFSVALFFRLVSRMEFEIDRDWLLVAGLSAVYLAVLGMLVVWLIPRRVLQAVGRKAAPPVKLALVFNLLTALLILQIWIGTWWERSLWLAGMFGVAWLASWLLGRLIESKARLRETLEADDPDSFDPSRPQGRKARFD